MRRRNKELDDEKDLQGGEVEETPELSEKEQKKLKQKKLVDKRKNERRKDKVARWGGVILLGLVMFVGFLLWVSGEMKREPRPGLQNTVSPYQTPVGQQQNSVIVR